MLRVALSLIIVVVLSANIQAGLVERDLHTLGDGLLTYDSLHKREWLDLSETYGMDLPSLTAAMSSGGLIDGFKLATLADVEELAISANVSWISPWQIPGVTGNEANILIELLGFMPESNYIPNVPTEILPGDFDEIVYLPSSPFSPYEGTLGFVFNDGLTVPYTAVVVLGNTERIPGQYNYPLSSLSHSWGGIFVQELELDVLAGPYWLYRAVPEPSSLMLLAIFGLFGGMRPHVMRGAGRIVNG